MIYGFNTGPEDTLKDDLRVFLDREIRPAPYSVVISELTNEETWGHIKNYEWFYRKKLKARLYSELSGQFVAEAIFTADEGLFKYLRPVLKVSAMFIGAANLPFDLPEEVGDIAADFADAIERLENMAPVSYTHLTLPTILLV